MRPGLDDALAALRDEAPDRDLSQLEARVWRRIDQARRGRDLGLRTTPYRLAAVLVALGLGTAVGVADAREGHDREQISAFRVATELAPSTLLDDRS